jgi:predicted nucleotidyltransferase
MNENNKINLSNQQKEKLIEIAKNYSLDILILFGSRASGNAKKESDYDFAYIRKKHLSFNEKESIQKEILKIINYKNFDLVEISIQTPIILKLEIIRKGIIIFSSNKKYYEFLKESSYFDYVDSKYLLEPTKEKFISSPL